MKSKNWDFKTASEAARGIEFWRAEYFKRKFKLDPNFFDYSSDFNILKGEWKDYLQCIHPTLYGEYSNTFIRPLLNTFSAMSQQRRYEHNGRELTFLFRDFLSQDLIRDICATLLEDVTNNYCYYIDDLLSPTDMERILRNISEPLPCHPLYGPNRTYKPPLPVEAISFFRLNYKSSSSFITPSDMVMLKTNDPLSSPGFPIYKAECFSRRADFAVMGQLLHEEFDLEIACQEIRDHLIFTLYEAKKEHNIPMTPKEKDLMVGLFTRMAKGEYGPTYVEARAIGLWLWDDQQKEPRKIQQSIQALKSKKLDLGHFNSDDRVFYRLLQRAAECIEAGAVLPITGKGANRKTTP